MAGTATGLSRTARAAQSRATSVEVMCGLAGRHPFAILSVESPGLGSVVGVAMSQLFEAAGKVSFGDGVITPDGLRQLRRRVHPAPKSFAATPWRGGIFLRSCAVVAASSATRNASTSLCDLANQG